MKNTYKIILLPSLLILFLVLSSNAIAARQVPGEVPKNEPLIPPPVGMKPNYEANINTPPDQTSNNTNSTSANQDQQNIPINNANDSSTEKPSGPNVTSKINRNNLKLFFLGLIIFIVVLVGIVLFRKKAVK